MQEETELFNCLTLAQVLARRDVASMPSKYLLALVRMDNKLGQDMRRLFLTRYIERAAETTGAYKRIMTLRRQMRLIDAAMQRGETDALAFY